MLATPVSAQNRETDNLVNFETVWRTVNETHFDPAFGGIDWQGMHDRYLPQIVAAGSLDEFNRIANRMLFELEMSHLLVASESMLKKYMPVLFAEGSSGLDVRWMKHLAVINKVKTGSPAHTAGLKPGFVIKQIDGRDVTDIVRTGDVIPPYNSRNYKNGVSNLILGHIDGAVNSEVSIVYLDGKDRRRETVIKRRSRGTGKIVDHAMPPVFVEFEAKRLRGNIGYIWFNHFAEPIDGWFISTLEAMRDTHGLIFDVRRNPGGYFRVVDAIVAQLITAPTFLYRFKLRNNTVNRSLTPSKNPYQKPVVVLIDVTSTSASEHFAACLQAIGRAVIVGDHSPGYLLGAKWIKLPNHASFMHTILQPIPSDGRIIEGKGVKPDIEIGLDRHDLLKGIDTQLEAAITQIIKMKAKRNAHPN